jgi:surface polysaccharide O-acyltransferase-like enzyme
MNPINMSIFGNGTSQEIIAKCSQIQSPSLISLAVLASVFLLIAGLIFFKHGENRKRLFWIFLLFVIFVSVIVVGINTLPNVFHDMAISVENIFAHS